MHSDEFVRKLDLDGHELNTLRIVPERGCVFFDKQTGKCGVFAQQPLDCRLFPLDIDLIEGRLTWIVYEHCGLSGGAIDKMIEYAETNILERFAREEILAYSKYGKRDMTLYCDRHWTVVKPVELRPSL